MSAEGACCESCASHEATNGHALVTLKSMEAMLSRLTPPSRGYASSFIADETGVNVIVPVANGRIWVMSYALVADQAVVVAWGGGNDQQFRRFQGNEGPNAGDLSLGAHTGVSHAVGGWPSFIFATDPGEALCLNVATNGISVGGHVSYFVGDPFLLGS